MASKTIGIRVNKKTGSMLSSIRKAVCSYNNKSDGQILTDALECLYIDLANTDNKAFIESMLEEINNTEPRYHNQLVYAERLLYRIRDILEVLSISNSTLLRDEFSNFLFVVGDEGWLMTSDPEDEISFNDTKQYETAWERISSTIKSERMDDYETNVDCIETCEEISKQEAEEKANKAIGELEDKILEDLDILYVAFNKLYPKYWEAETTEIK